MDDVCLKAGNLVRIRPKGRADVMDMALAGKTAVIEAVERTRKAGFISRWYLEDDPGKIWASCASRAIDFSTDWMKLNPCGRANDEANFDCRHREYFSG